MKKIEDSKRAIQRRQQRQAKRILTEYNLASSMIQAATRQFLMRRKCRRHQAAMSIASTWKMHHAVQQISKLRQEKGIARENQAAKIIYRFFRLVGYVRTQEEMLTKANSAAIIVQTTWRVFQSKILARTLRQNKQQKIEQWNNVIKIQSAYRGFLVRQAYLDVIYLVRKIQLTYRHYRMKCQAIKHTSNNTDVSENNCNNPGVSAQDQIASQKSMRPEESSDEEDVSNTFDRDKMDPILLSNLLRQQWKPIGPNVKVLPRLAAATRHMSYTSRSSFLDGVRCNDNPVQTTKKLQRRKTIAVKLSPMPYKTVILQQPEDTASIGMKMIDSHEEAMKRAYSQSLRRKVQAQKEREKLIEYEKVKKLDELQVYLWILDSLFHA